MTLLERASAAYVELDRKVVTSVHKGKYDGKSADLRDLILDLSKALGDSEVLANNYKMISRKNAEGSNRMLRRV